MSVLPPVVRECICDRQWWRDELQGLHVMNSLFKSDAAFFRRGTSGAGCEILSDDEIAGYHARAAQLAPADLLAWLHSPGQSR